MVTHRNEICLPLPGRHAITIGMEGDRFVRFGCPGSTPVFAVAGGRVAVAEASGTELVIRLHGDSRRLHYRRLSVGSLRVSIGDEVRLGQLIAEVGDAGESRTIAGLICGLETEAGDWLDCRSFFDGAFDPIMVPGSLAGVPTSAARRRPRRKSAMSAIGSSDVEVTNHVPAAEHPERTSDGEADARTEWPIENDQMARDAEASRVSQLVSRRDRPPA